MMNEGDLDQIFRRTEDGLNPSELAQVAEVVEKSTDTTLQHRGLHILGWAHAQEYTPLIATFLSRRDDLLLPEMAIRALVLWFEDAEPYLPDLKAFLAGIPEDEYEGLKLVALQATGAAYQKTSDPDILRSIVSFLNDENLAFRDAARGALVHALTPNWGDLTPYERHVLRQSFKTSDLPEQAQRILDQQ